MSEPLEDINKDSESSKNILHDLSQEEIKFRLKQLSQYRQDPVAFEYELVKLAKDWQTSIEECRHLWRICGDELESDKLSVRRKWKRWRAPINKVLGIIAKIGQYSILVGVIAFLAEAGTRERQSINAAWQVINNVDRDVKANAGRGEALEFLNRGCTPRLRALSNFSMVDAFVPDCVNLKGLDLHGVHLLGVYLPYANLDEAKFQDADLEGADLSAAQLQSSNFENANLRRVNLSGMNSLQRTVLHGSSLKGTDLANANLRYADLTNANLDFANLEGANLQDVDLTNTSLFGASLRRAVYNPQTKPFEQLKELLETQRAYLIDVESQLQGADLEEIDLRGAELAKSDLEAANLQNANLRNADLTSANLRKVNFRGADLDRATLHNADVMGAIYDSDTQIPSHFRRVFHRDAYLIGPKQNLAGANLQNMDLQGVNLQEANLKGATLERANLRKADLRKADLNNTNLQGAIYDIDTRFPDGFSPEGKGLNYIEHDEKLGNINLEKFDLQGINLVNADLQGSNLSEADLRGASLNGADLKNANLAYANMSDSSLIPIGKNITNLQEANLQGVDLRGANLRGANLNHANIEGANLTQTKGLTPEQIKQAKNWEKAQYSLEMAKKLGLSSD